jgi:hypothetical protein
MVSISPFFAFLFSFSFFFLFHVLCSESHRSLTFVSFSTINIINSVTVTELSWNGSLLDDDDKIIDVVDNFVSVVDYF